MADKLKSWDALKNLRNKTKEEKEKNSGNNDIVLAVGMATCGVAAGAGKVMQTLRDEIQKADLKNVTIVSTGCYGFCYAEPMVEVRTAGKPGTKYGYVDEDIARAIVQKHVLKGETLNDNIIKQEVQRP